MAGSGLSRSVLPASTKQTQERPDNMAHIHIAATPGVTIDGFRAVAAKHNPPQDIDGLLAWAAGTDSSGLHVVTVWESKAHQDRWSAEQLFPAFQALGMTDVTSNMEFTEYDADELYIR
jgi:heme-degrading monooxygenase HmoA